MVVRYSTVTNVLIGRQYPKPFSAFVKTILFSRFEQRRYISFWIQVMGFGCATIDKDKVIGVDHCLRDTPCI